MLHSLFLFTEAQKCMCQRDIYNGLQSSEKRGLTVRCLAMRVKSLFTELTFICPALVHGLDGTAHMENGN